MARRMDMVTAVTRLLLDNSTFSEAVTLQRCARLLAGDIASWVIVDVERSGELRRQFVIGPHGERPDELARKAARRRPAARLGARPGLFRGPVRNTRGTRMTPGFSALTRTGHRC